jgi:hypothetical protein
MEFKFSDYMSLFNLLLNIWSKRKELSQDLIKCSKSKFFNRVSRFMPSFVLASMLFAGFTVAIMFYTITYRDSLEGLLLSLGIVLFTILFSSYIFKGLNQTSKYVSVLNLG